MTKIARNVERALGRKDEVVKQAMHNVERALGRKDEVGKVAMHRPSSRVRYLDYLLFPPEMWNGQRRKDEVV